MAVRREKAERLADEELTPLVGANDAEAFAVLYDRHGGAAYSLAYRIVGEAGSSEAVTQEASSRSGTAAPATIAPRQRPLVDAEHRPQPGDRRAAGGVRKAPKLNFDDEAVLEQRPAPERTEEEAIQRETAGELRGVLGGLPASRRR